MGKYLQYIMLMEVLLDSDMVGTVSLGYFFLFLILFVSFVNIYSVDKIEFMYNEQRCIEFKRSIFFIIQKSKNKKIISIKTFVLELIAYLLLLLIITSWVLGFVLNVKTALVVLGVNALAVLVFGCITAFFYKKSKKHNYNA